MSIDGFYGFIQTYIEKLEKPFFEKDGKLVDLDSYMFLNFNYTPFLKNVKDNYGFNNMTINHIHGTLSDRDSVIFGFGDELDKDYQTIESERSKELFRNIKSAHYFKNWNYKKLKSFIDVDNFDVLIVGHSCGISDRTLLNEIFEHEKCVTIKILHYKMNEKENDFFDKSIEIMRHFKDKKLMRNRIHPFDDNDGIPQFKMKSR